VIAALRTLQALAWASSSYLPAILADPIAAGIGVPRAWVFAAFSISLLIAALIGPFVGSVIDRRGGRNVPALSNFVLAAGLVALATAAGPVGLFGAWVVLGVGMALRRRRVCDLELALWPASAWPDYRHNAFCRLRLHGESALLFLRAGPAA
jgi:MFS family permease